MSPSKASPSWTDPNYVATVVGVLAVKLPATVAYEVTRRAM